MPYDDPPARAIRDGRGPAVIAAARDQVLPLLGDDVLAVDRLPKDLRPDRRTSW